MKARARIIQALKWWSLQYVLVVMCTLCTVTIVVHASTQTINAKLNALIAVLKARPYF